MKAIFIKIFVLILILVIVLLIYSFIKITISHPGLLINFDEESWMREEIGKPFLKRKHIKIVMKKLKNLRIYEQLDQTQYIGYIGTAGYLNTNYKKYMKKSKSSNVYLWKECSNILEIIRIEIENRVEKKCIYPARNKYLPNFSLPGFHIFKGGTLLSSGWSVASIHIDLQYKNLEWPKNKVFDFDDTLSFTLPLQMPENCGLYMFELKKGDSLSFPVHRYNNVRKEKIIYQEGHLYIHNGHIFHMIAPFNSNMERITIQGHGVYCKTDKCYWLYW